MYLSSSVVLFTGTILIWLIKWVVRPVYGADPQTFFGFLLGVAPNFLGSLLIPFAAAWLQNWPTILGAFFRVDTPRFLQRTCIFGYALVVVNESLQLLPVFGRTFHWNDLLFSIAGTVLSFYLFRYWQEGMIKAQVVEAKKMPPVKEAW